LTSVWDARYEISRMPSRIYRIKSERVLEDNESGDDDDDDQGLFDDFVMISKQDVNNIEEEIKRANDPETL